MPESFLKIPKRHYSENYLPLYFEASYFLDAALALKEKSHLQSVELKERYRALGMLYASEVNHAYAFELFLKCIMVIENKHYFSGHHLLELFKKLNQKTQRSIIEIYSSNYKIVRRNRKYIGIFEDLTFLDLLTETNEAFVDLRYHFDRGEKGNLPSYDLWDAINCLKIYIKKIKPDIET